MAKESEDATQVSQAAAEQSDEQARLADEIEDAVDGGGWPVEKLRPVLEAVLFAAADPIAPKKLAEIVDGATRLELNAALALIEEDFKDRGFRLVQVAGGWQLRTAPEHQSIVRKMFKERPFRLTRAALETLAIVAYRQPITRSEVESVRGVDCSGVLESLVERKVVRVAGRRDVPGRPLVYATTPMFLEMFALKDLKSLPTLSELGDEFTNMAEQAGFHADEDAEAAVLPLEGEDGEEQASAEHADERRTLAQQDRAEVDQDDDEEDDDAEVGLSAADESDDDGKGGLSAASESDDDLEPVEQEGERQRRRTGQGDDVPKIRFRARSAEDEATHDDVEDADDEIDQAGDADDSGEDPSPGFD